MGNVTDMSSMFRSSPFNGDISDWDVSNVTDMGDMFATSSAFTGDISKWNFNPSCKSSDKPCRPTTIGIGEE